jgi:predicted membrane protein
MCDVGGMVWDVHCDFRLLGLLRSGISSILKCATSIMHGVAFREALLNMLLLFQPLLAVTIKWLR